MKKTISSFAAIIFFLVLPTLASAATVTPLTGTNGNFTVTLNGSDPWVAWWTSSGTYISGSDTSGSFSFGSTPGTYYLTTLQDVTQVQHGAYCGEALVTVNTTLSNCTSIPTNSFDAAGGVEWTYTVTAPPPLPALFSAASSSALIESGFSTWSKEALIILGAVIIIFVGLLVFYWGYRKLKRVAR